MKSIGLSLEGSLPEGATRRNRAHDVNDGASAMTPRQIKRRILEAIHELQGGDESSVIGDAQVAERTGFNLKVVRDYMVSVQRRREPIPAFGSGPRSAF
jgi:hypothetical protein